VYAGVVLDFDLIHKENLATQVFVECVGFARCRQEKQLFFEAEYGEDEHVARDGAGEHGDGALARRERCNIVGGHSLQEVDAIIVSHLDDARVGSII